VILPVAIIAAITLTLRDTKSRKAQVVSEQVKVRAQDRVRVVKMDSSKPDSDQEAGS